MLEVDESGRAKGAPRDFANTPFHETSAAMSPDGRWVSYESNELDGVFQVYARAFPTGSNKMRASTGGARWPAWDAHGSLHFWQSQDDTLWAVPVRAEREQPVVSTSEPVWRWPTSSVVKHIDHPVAGARYARC